MDDQTKAVVCLTGAATIIVGATVKYIKTVVTERRKRKEIERQEALSLLTMDYASNMVAMRAMCGEYEPWELNKMMDDMEFYRLMSREEI